MFLLLSLFLFHPVLAYDQHSTHPSLTQEMVEFFNGTNTQTSRKLSTSEAQWLKQGAVDEDEPARWINHFYDPVHGVGWSGKHFGRLSTEEGYKKGGDIAPRHSIPSVDWVTNQDYQSAYGRQFGNQTWQKAVKSYLDGDKKSAFIALGHVLHLVEDVTVPDHVRDDSHAGIEGDPGSPYEAFAKVQTDKGSLDTAEVLLKNKKSFKKLISVNQAIKDLAVQVNRNFFSEDTISNEEFLEPKIDSLTRVNKTTTEGIKIYLAKEGVYLAAQHIKGGNTIFTTVDSRFVLPSYRDHLFPEAVLTGASVINLFFDEVDKYKQHPELLESIMPNSNDSFLSALAQFPKRTVIKACGISESTCKQMYNSLDNIADAIKNTSQTITAGLANTLNTILDSAKTKLGLSSSQPISLNTPQLAESSALIGPLVNQPLLTVQTPGIVLGEKISANQPPAQPVEVPKAPVLVLPAPEIKKESVPVAPVPVQNNIFQGSSLVSTRPEPVASNLSENESVVDTTTVGTTTPVVEDVFTTTTPPPTTSTSITVPNTTLEIITTTRPEEVVMDNSPPLIPVLSFLNQSGVSSTDIIINVQSSDISLPIYFDVEIASSTVDPWQLLVSSTTSTSIPFSGRRGQVYYFRARAMDAVGHISDWSPTSSPVSVNWSQEVVINEVAWAGTGVSYPNDEWFELYNNTDQPIDFTGWKVLVSGKEISISKMNNKIIPANGYYLFERTSDDTVKQINADAVYKLTGGFGNGGEKIELIKPNGEKADEVNASEGWFAGDAVLYRSMERIGPLVDGNNPANWQTNQGFRETGRTFNGGQIYGSPKRSNFGFITLNFNQDDAVRTLTKANNPYILQSYVIPVGKSLIIEPGVVLKSYYNPAKIDVFGNLQVLGSAEEKVVFTSGRDAQVGAGAVNTVVGTWPSPTSSPQDWQGLWFHSGSTGILDHISMRYAGKGFVVPPNALPVSQAIRSEGANLLISDSDFSDNGALTLFEKDSASSIIHTSFKNGDRAVESEASNLSILDSIFENFTHSNGPLYIKDKWPTLSNLQYHNNVLNMPFLESVTITEPDVSIGESENVLANILKVSTSSTLHIEPGAAFYMPLYGIMEVRGAIVAEGTAEKPINFLPYPSTINWGNIRLYGAQAIFDHVNFVQGNRLNGRPENLNGMIIANDSNLVINNSNLSDSESNSIQSNNSIVQISNANISVTTKANNTRGVKAGTGRINLDNVNFNNLYIGMESGSSDLTQLLVDVQNMSSSSFSNVDYFWQPFNLWSFPPPNVENLVNL